MSIKKIMLLRLVSDEITKGQHPRNRIIPFELKYIEVLLKKKNNLKVELFDQILNQWSNTELVEIIHSTKPQVVVISFTILERYKVEYLKKSCRNNSIIFVGIGQGVGAYSIKYINWLMEQFDLLIPGEPEVNFISCINEILNGVNIQDLRQKIWNGYLEKGQYIVKDIDALPMPKYKPSEIENYANIYPIKSNKRLKWGHILASRGCLHKCLFCSPIMRMSYGKKMRYRNAESVVNEIEMLMKSGANIISFEDDDFTYSSQYIEQICRKIIKKNLKIHWVAHARIDEVSLDLMKLMKKSGCVLLRFGVESGQQRVIDSIKKGDGMKWRMQTKKVFSQLKRLKIDTSAMFIIGNPAEIIEEIEDTIKFAKELKPDTVQVAFFEIYPGSPLFKNLTPEDKEKILESIPYHYRNIVANLSKVDNQELIRLHRKFYRSFVLRPQFLLSHICKYFLFYLKNQATFKLLVKGLLNCSVLKKDIYENFVS